MKEIVIKHNGIEYSEDWFTIIKHTNTSSPCSQCYFFNNSTLKCEFPEEKNKKECKTERGYVNGWNSWEYQLIPKPLYEYYNIKQ